MRKRCSHDCSEAYNTATGNRKRGYCRPHRDGQPKLPSVRFGALEADMAFLLGNNDSSREETMADITLTLHEASTRRLVADIARLLEHSDASQLGAVVRRLGGFGRGTRGEFGFWIPALARHEVHVELEILVAISPIEPGSIEPTACELRKTVVPMMTIDDFAFAVVDGLMPGTHNRIGPLYRALVHRDDGEVEPIIDPLALSAPFGAFAPSELMDVDELFGDRADASYYAAMRGDDADVPRIEPAVNILQVHVPTATESGTLAGLTRVIDAVAARIRAGEPLSVADRLWLGYDALQLMPIEPTIRRERGRRSWEVLDETEERVRARLRRPTATNWGYDVVIGGSAAVNPAILETGRPHELSALACSLHNFPGRPIKLILDMVFGHADNQAIEVMPEGWFSGPDMYGQHLDYRNPVVRCHLLEMQRRKAQHGADGVRVDGSQDYTWWDAEREVLVHDDELLMEMSDVVQEVAGARYRSWMIFEDGRPWPRPDWELASSYREVTARQPHAFQWGPLTFSHNTPFLFTFWLSKWWRLREVAERGDAWISGCANHDTLRRGSQVDPDGRINTYLGEHLTEVIGRAYDHPASMLLFHGFLPGVPMDFLQSITRAPWSFIRNTDHRYAIKVWAEEARFLDWRVTPEAYDNPTAFLRLKELGFVDLDSLTAFMAPLQAAVAIHQDAIEPVVAAAQLAPQPEGFLADEATLVDASQRWMDDVRDYCSVPRSLAELDPEAVAFDLEVRRHRLAARWLRTNLCERDLFDYVHPTNGSVIFYGLRHGPDGERLLFVANMEGAPTEVVPAQLLGLDDESGFQLILSTPRVDAAGLSRPTILTDGEGMLFLERSER